MFRYLCLSLFLLCLLQAFGQEPKVEAELMIQSRHVWRGTKLGTAPAIEPSVTISSGRFSFNFWAAQTTDNSYSEIDLIPSYTFGSYTLTLFDYYNPVPGDVNQYFNFRQGKNRHSLELALDNFSSEEQRLKWMIGTFIAGDKNSSTGNPYFSTYLEIRYPFSFHKIKTEPFLGATPLNGYYAKETAIVNSGISLSREINISEKFSLPITAAYIWNPYKNKQMVTIALGLVFSSDN